MKALLLIVISLIAQISSADPSDCTVTAHAFNSGDAPLRTFTITGNPYSRPEPQTIRIFGEDDAGSTMRYIQEYRREYLFVSSQASFVISVPTIKLNMRTGGISLIKSITIIGLDLTDRGTTFEGRGILRHYLEHPGEGNIDLMDDYKAQITVSKSCLP